MATNASTSSVCTNCGSKRSECDNCDVPSSVAGPAQATQHTAGSWKAAHSGLGDAKVIETITTKHGNIDCVIVPRCSWDYARLIAAAPAMLAKLKEIAELHGNFCGLNSTIAKAEGRA